MQKLELVNDLQLSREQLVQVARLLFETGKYEQASLDNQLKLSPLDFQIEQTLKPLSKYTYTFLKDKEVAGFIIATTKQQLKEIEKNTPNFYKQSQEIEDILQKINHFYVHEASDNDFILYGIAISDTFRGQGLFKMLYQFLLTLTRQNNCRRIIFTVWENKPAVDIYLHYGAKILGNLDFTHTEFNGRLLKCALPLVN